MNTNIDICLKWRIPYSKFNMSLIDIYMYKLKLTPRFDVCDLLYDAVTIKFNGLPK